MRAVSILEVVDPSVWDEIAAAVPIDAHLEERLDAHRAVVGPSFVADALPGLAERGVDVLVRYARRAGTPETTEGLQGRVDALPPEARRVLYSAQRHARAGVVRGFHAWDPVGDADTLGTLHAAGLLRRDPEDPAPGWAGRFRLHADLPDPPPRPLDFAEAVMGETDDLSRSLPGPATLLQDMAGLAAAIGATTPKRTYAGPLARADARRLGRRLGVPELARDGLFEAHPRWVRALQGLEVLGAVSIDPIQRLLFLDLGVEDLLGGTTAQAVDRLVRRLVPWDLHPLLDAIRAALARAGDQALDEAIFFELLHEQARDLLFPAWTSPDGPVYPTVAGEHARPYDDAGWDTVETRLGEKTLAALVRVGVLRRAPGIFAAGPDGRAWAGVGPVAPALWCGSDLELVVPPGALTPWERFQLERLTTCLARDVVDRHRLERAALTEWLATHDLDEALALLDRRCLAVPTSVVETITGWARTAQRVVLTRGVLLDPGGTSPGEVPP